MEMMDKLIRASDALRMIANSQQDNPYTGTLAGPVWGLAHNSCISCVEVCAQVVDVKEVVHGRWLRGYPIHLIGVICMAFSVIATVIVSLLTKKPDDRYIENAFDKELEGEIV